MPTIRFATWNVNWFTPATCAIRRTEFTWPQSLEKDCSQNYAEHRAEHRTTHDAGDEPSESDGERISRCISNDSTNRLSLLVCELHEGLRLDSTLLPVGRFSLKPLPLLVALRHLSPRLSDCRFHLLG